MEWDPFLEVFRPQQFRAGFRKPPPDVVLVNVYKFRLVFNVHGSIIPQADERHRVSLIC
jgi:hypothetical protein